MYWLRWIVCASNENVSMRGKAPEANLIRWPFVLKKTFLSVCDPQSTCSICYSPFNILKNPITFNGKIISFNIWCESREQRANLLLSSSLVVTGTPSSCKFIEMWKCTLTTLVHGRLAQAAHPSSSSGNALYGCIAREISQFISHFNFSIETSAITAQRTNKFRNFP